MENNRNILRTLSLLLFCLFIGIVLANAPRIANAQATFDCTSVTEIPQIECEALITFYEEMDGPNWSDNSDWLLTNTPCSWFGLVCNAGSVHEINLDNNQLSGTIPTEIAYLTNLRQLRLQDNNLTGTIPSQLGNLNYLIGLRLQSNQLSGSIPAELGNLSELWMLYLADNELNGDIPPELGNLDKLKWIFLWENQLTGTIPSELGNMSNLIEIQFASNQLTGNIPIELGQLAYLETLYLNDNQLGGTIPTELGNLSNLQILALPNNQINGNIPSALGNLLNLQTLHLHSNQLNGNIPSELGNLSNLQDLLVNDNPSLFGALPQELANLTSLNTFYFNSTSICEPGDAIFQAWLDGITDLLSTGDLCPIPSSSIRYPLNADPSSLDPSTTGYNRDANTVVTQLYENLFHYNPEGDIVPAGALGYSLSLDERTYTINLRPGAEWSDGEPVVAKHYVDGLLRVGMSELAHHLYPVSGFEDWSEGIITDPALVGINAPNDTTLEITLDEPTAHFMTVLASGRIAFPVRLVDPFGDPLGPILGPNVSNGPYVLSGWDGDHITVTKNATYWNTAAVEIEEIQFPFMSAPNQFDAYLNGELEVSGYPGYELPYITGDPLLSAELRIAPYPGTLYVGLNTAIPHTQDRNMRLALATSLDKEALIDYQYGFWLEPATGTIPSGMPGHQETLGYDFNIGEAQAYLQDYIDATPGITQPSDITLNVWFNEASRRLVEAVIEMWEVNLEVNVNPASFLWDDYLDQLGFCRWNPLHIDCAYDVYRMGWVVDHLDPWDMIGGLFHPDGELNHTHWDNAQYRLLLDQIWGESDEATRSGYLQDADRILVEEEVVVIPIWYTSRPQLIKPYVSYEYPASGTPPHIMNWSLLPQSIYTVTSTEDPGVRGDGELTLREAIEAANANPGQDAIHFDIPGTAPHTIQPTSVLPNINDPVIIDGYSQMGASPNTNPPMQGSNAILQVELDGSGLGSMASGLTIHTSDSVIRGLVIHNFDSHGIAIENASSTGNQIQGNFIGTDVSGTLALGNQHVGIWINDAPQNVVGGATAADVNLISGNAWGFRIEGPSGPNDSFENQVHGNLIGTDRSGTSVLGNTIHGVFVGRSRGNIIGPNNIISGNAEIGVVLIDTVDNTIIGNLIGTDRTGSSSLPNLIGVDLLWASGNTIGGDIEGEGNVISGNSQEGILFEDETSTGNRVQGNFIGTDIYGVQAVGNQASGIQIFEAAANRIESNTIAFNHGDGVRVEGFSAIENTITGNSIHDNVGKGIENESGGNFELQPPIIEAMLGDRIEGRTDPDSTVEIFADINGEGRAFLGSIPSNDSGFFIFDGPLSGPNITATVTDPGGNTSEFSDPVFWAPDNCEFNDSFEEACDISSRLGFTLGSFGSFQSYLSRPDDIDWFMFEVPESLSPGSELKFTLSGEAGFELPANFDLVVMAEMSEDTSTVPAPLQGVPLQGVPLQGVPLQGVPLQGVDAQVVPLQGVPLQGVEVRDIPLQGVPLQGVPLQGVPLQGVPLQGVPLQGVGFHSGTTVEEVSLLYRGGMTGRIYVMVWSSSSEFSIDPGSSPYEVNIQTDEVSTEACTTHLGGNFGISMVEPVGNQINPKTLFLVHQPRMIAMYGDGGMDLVMNALESLVVHPLVDGLILDLADPSALIDPEFGQELEFHYASWDGNGCNTEAANLVSLSIKKIILEVIDRFTIEGGESSIEYLVLVGNDTVIPYRRVPDEVVRTPDGATVPNEFDYQNIIGGVRQIGDVETVNSPTFASLRLQYYLSDDFYADLSPILLDHGHELSVPDLPISRLVEDPVTISNYIQYFLMHDGVMSEAGTISSMVTGYEFLIDQAEAVNSIFEFKGFSDRRSLISEDWTQYDFRVLYDTSPDAPGIGSMNAHFDHWHLAPALMENDVDFLSTHEVQSFAADMSGSLWFSVGCHFGLNFPDGEALNEEESGILDFPQVLLDRGVTVIGNTGFGYGDDAALAYSEELMLQFARYLGGSGIGHSLMQAKREYLLNQAELDPIHEKVLMESVFYGLPMWEFTAPIPEIPSGIITEYTPDSQNDLTVRDYSVQVISTSMDPVNIPDRGSYFALEGQTQAALYRPIQPKTSIDVGGEPGEVAHGVLFLGGNYVDYPNFDPVITMPSWTRENPEPQFVYEGWDPARFWSLAQLERGDGSFDERLVIVPGQFITDTEATVAGGVTVGTERIYDDLEFEIFYESNATEFLPPVIQFVQAGYIHEGFFGQQGMIVAVQVTDPGAMDDQLGIVRVVVTYTEESGGSLWRSEDLTYYAGAQLWSTTLPITDSIDFFIQAVDRSGNVGMFTGNGYMTPVSIVPEGPGTVLVGQPVEFSVEHSLENPTLLWDFRDDSFGEGENTTHAFSQPGTYSIAIRAVDDSGNLGWTRITVQALESLEEIDEHQQDLFFEMDEYFESEDLLPDSALDGPAANRRQTLMNKLDEIQTMVYEGDLQAAVQKLNHDLRAKMDGCPFEPDNNDWITDCTLQYELQALIDELAGALEALIWSYGS